MKTAYLSYTTPNIGDDVQSLALEKLLGPPDLFLNRDKLDSYCKAGNIRLLANGWFVGGPFPPTRNIQPIYIALCIGNLHRLGTEARDHLKNHEPIGCRDHHTLDWCESNGIDCYYSSCPSILLQRDSPYNPDGPVVLVDVDPSLLPLTSRSVIWVSHHVDFTEKTTPPGKTGRSFMEIATLSICVTGYHQEVACRNALPWFRNTFDHHRTVFHLFPVWCLTRLDSNLQSKKLTNHFLET